LTVALAIAAAVPAAVSAQEVAEATVVYLVRHAEKADDDPNDPTLAPEGEARAAELIRVLGDAGVTHLWSTPYRRTEATVAPLARALGLEVMSYRPGDTAFVETLRSTPGGRIVVSAHSNTTPGLVEALGGDPVSEIPEWEYDRLYVVVLAADGSVTSTLLRYGEPSSGG
jgi:broad specificity phosphatase PhoE